MSIRWRCDGTLVCGAKSEPRNCDTYIDDMLHYKLSVELKVLIADNNKQENGLWYWVNEEGKE